MTSIHLKTAYTDFDTTLRCEIYGADPAKRAIHLTAMQGDVPVLKLSIWDAKETNLADDEIVIKTYNENEGVKEAVVEAGLGKITRVSASNWPVLKVTHKGLLADMKAVRDITAGKIASAAKKAARAKKPEAEQA